MKNYNNIESVYIKYFSGQATEEEIQVIHDYLNQSVQHKANFEELRNVWEASHPAFDPADIALVNAREKVIHTLEMGRPHAITAYPKIRSSWKYAAAIFIPLLIASFFIFKNIQEASKLANAEYKEIVSPGGKVTQLILADGTKVILNANSKLTYPDLFNGEQRNVTLEGEGYFDVAHNVAKPFVVHTAKMDIQVLGTKFNINAYADLSEVKATLVEGKVKVSIPNSQQNNANDSFYLIPNEQLTINVETGDIAKKQVNAAESSSWLSGGMVFNSTLLDDALKQIARKYNVEIESRDSNFVHKRLTVRFEGTETLNDVLDGLKTMIPGFSINKLNDSKYVVRLAE